MEAISSLKNSKGSTTKEIQKYLSLDSMDRYNTIIKLGILHLQMKNLISPVGPQNRWVINSIRSDKEAICVCPGDEKKVKKGAKKPATKKPAKKVPKKVDPCAPKKGLKSASKSGKGGKSSGPKNKVVEFCADAKKVKSVKKIQGPCPPGKAFISFKAEHTRAAPFKAPKKSIKSEAGAGDCVPKASRGVKKVKKVAGKGSKGKSAGRKNKKQKQSKTGSKNASKKADCVCPGDEKKTKKVQKPKSPSKPKSKPKPEC